MMQRKEIIRNLLIILFVFVLAMIPWASVIGIQDPGLLDTIVIVQRTGAFLVLTGMITKLIYQIYYNKPLTQEMMDEESKEADQKDGKPLLFKPPIVVSVVFMGMILGFGFCIIILANDNANLGLNVAGIGLILFFIWMWYLTPVFIFTEDSVHIKSHLLYLLGINRKTVIRYADITSVSPDANMNGTYGVEPMHRVMITSNGTTQAYGLICYNSDIVAKIYLRFKEKLGDKVTIQ